MSIQNNNNINNAITGYEKKGDAFAVAVSRWALRSNISRVWYEFEDGLKNKNRFFTSKDFLNYLEKVVSDVSYIDIFKKGDNLYRARIIELSDIKDIRACSHYLIAM